MERLNVLLFFTDDHGQWAAACYGNRELHTPTMDWLAQTGTRLTHAYTPCPVCSPARSSFHTGRIPSAHGVHDYIQEPNNIHNHPGIQGQDTIAQALQRSGYHTGLVGKWHCGGGGDPQPGFDFWFSMRHGTAARFGQHRFDDNGSTFEAHGQQAPIITDHTLRFLRQRPADQPFFLHVGYTDTHSPFATRPDRLVAHYRKCSFDDIPREPADDRHRVRWPTPDPQTHHEQLAQYYASVTLIDEQMGRIVDELESMGLLESTLILYTSDHGHNNGHHGMYTKGNGTVPQNFYEESIRVPCLARCPGQVRAGAVVDAFADHCDLYATVLDTAGLDVDAVAGTRPSPGRSLWPLWRGQQTQGWRAYQCCELGNARMIRNERYKLIRRYPGPNGHFPDEFYDLHTDPRERQNLIDQPAVAPIIAELSQRMEGYFRQHEDPVRRGRDIASQPLANDSHPWVMPREASA